MVTHRLLDAGNKMFNHFTVAIFTSALFFILVNSGVTQAASSSWIAFFLLFLTLIVGPLMQIIKPSAIVLPWGLPWSWRGELGIWFTLWALAHILFIFQGQNWQVASFFKNMNLAGFTGLVAFFWAVVLAATSSARVIRFLGVDSWRWLHSFSYVIFYMASAHMLHHSFFRVDRPSDWKHWSYLAMMVTVAALQFWAFWKVVLKKKKEDKEAGNKL